MGIIPVYQPLEYCFFHIDLAKIMWYLLSDNLIFVKPWNERKVR